MWISQHYCPEINRSRKNLLKVDMQDCRKKGHILEDLCNMEWKSKLITMRVKSTFSADVFLMFKCALPCTVNMFC